MPIYFNLSSHQLPLKLASIGNRWDQEPISRPKGYPLYHWLQTEKGKGQIIVNGKAVELGEGEGILLAPFIPHSYCRTGKQWITAFVTFSGTLEPEIQKITGKSPVILSNAQTGQKLGRWIEKIIAEYENQQLDAMRLSVGCYEFLMQLAENQSYHVPSDSLYQQYVEQF